MSNKKSFEVHDCEWKNESSCEEDIEEDGLNFEEEGSESEE
jgi:hypothetical protein